MASYHVELEEGQPQWTVPGCLSMPGDTAIKNQITEIGKKPKKQKKTQMASAHILDVDEQTRRHV